MSKDLCRNEDLYLHKKLDGMFVFISLRHQRGQGEKVKKKQEGNDNKIPFLNILGTKSLNKANIKQANIVISMKFPNEGPTPELVAIRCWSFSCDNEQ